MLGISGTMAKEKKPSGHHGAGLAASASYAIPDGDRLLWQFSQRTERL